MSATASTAATRPPSTRPPSTNRYLEIADELAAELSDAVPGSRVPSEHSLSARYGVSRAAARGALQELERRMLVRRVQGAGTFVNRRIDYLVSREQPPSWSATLRAAGVQPRSVMLGLRRIALCAPVAERLQVPAGTSAHLMTRLAYADDLPATYADEYVPVDIVHELNLAMAAAESLHVVLAQMGRVHPQRASVRVSLDVPPPHVREHLELELSQPAWHVESVNSDADTGRPIMMSRAWMRADVLRVVVEFETTANGGQP